MNFLQTIGALGLVAGALTGFLRITNAPLPKWNVGGGELLLILPPDWVILAMLVGGIILLVVGTAWKAATGRGAPPEERPME